MTEGAGNNLWNSRIPELTLEPTGDALLREIISNLS